MTKWIVSGVLIALTVLFACLKFVWVGFVYFGVSSLSLLCLYWIYERIKLYRKDYHLNFEQAFIAYKADYINYSNSSTEDFENNIQEHYKYFKKMLRREKFIDIFKIIFILMVFVVCIVAMIGI